jgi:hypothetical protein
MTALGAVFGIAYVLALFRGRRSVLFVIAASIGFNDSAAIVVGNVTLSAYYLGLLIYIVTAVLRRPEASAKTPAGPRVLLWLLLAYSLVVTFIAPFLAAGLGVVSPAIGLDQQVTTLTPLSFTSSNIAQAAYLVLNVAFLLLLFRERLVSQSQVFAGFTVGVLVAFVGCISWLGHISWPYSFFDNSPRGFYSTEIARPRAQFSEPSHLGAFALTAAAFFLITLMQSKSPRQVVGRGLMTLLAAVTFAFSASGTGLGGAVIGGAIILGASVIRVWPKLPSLRIPVPLFLAGLVAVVVLVVATPKIVAAAVALVQSKQDSTSASTRSLTNSRAIDVLWGTHGFGAGLGSNSTSSLFYLVLGQIGIIGSILFFALMTVAIVRGLRSGENLASVVALTSILAAAVVSLALFNLPQLWFLVAVTLTARKALPSPPLEPSAADEVAPRRLARR